MNLVLHPETVDEVREAVAFYEQRQPGLGLLLDEALGQAYETILQAPDRWPTYTANTRRLRLKRFPYSVVYRVHEDWVFVVAVTHHRRKPDYWLERLPD